MEYKLQEFIDNLNLTNKGDFKNGAYIVRLEDSDEYAHYYSILDKSDLILNDEDMVVTPEESKLVYFNDIYNVLLYANYKDEIYKIKIEENN